MKATFTKRFTEDQRSEALKDAETIGVAEAAKKHKVSTPTIYSWRKSAGIGVPVSTHKVSAESADARELRLVRQLLAAREQEIAVLREYLTLPF